MSGHFKRFWDFFGFFHRKIRRGKKRPLWMNPVTCRALLQEAPGQRTKAMGTHAVREHMEVTHRTTSQFDSMYRPIHTRCASLVGL